MKHWEYRCWPQIGSWAVSTLQVLLQYTSWHQWPIRSIVQVQFRSSAASSLCERSDLTFIIEGCISFHQGTARSSQIRRKAPGRTHTHTVARRALRHLGRHYGRRRRCFNCEQKRVVRWLSSRSSGDAWRGEILWHFQELAFPLWYSKLSALSIKHTVISSLDNRFFLVSDDSRETSFLCQRLSQKIQRFNSVCFCHSFGNLPAPFFDQPRHTYKEFYNLR